MDGNLELLRKLLPQMSFVMNMVTGDKIPMQDGEMLLILQRRMEESDLQKELAQFNEVFANVQDLSIEHLAVYANAYVRLKVLVENGAYDFQPSFYRILVKEYENQISKIENLIHLTEANSFTVEPYQAEKNKRMLEKNQAFLEVFRREVEELELRLEQEPKELEVIEEVIPIVEEKCSREEKPEVSDGTEKKEMERPSKFATAMQGIASNLSRVKRKSRVEEQLEEKNKSMTRCGELTCYERKLAFTEVLPCKDITAYSLLKKKDRVYFGLTENIRKRDYDNEDITLMELTEVTDEFIQFMTEDLLQEKYQLVAFSEREKESLCQYYNFMNWCFEQQIGIHMTAQEYVNFKLYYNRLVSRMFELEKQATEDYYIALLLANQYRSYIQIYDMECDEVQKEIATNILGSAYEKYIQKIEELIVNHIADECAREELISLGNQILLFHGKDQIFKDQELDKDEVDKLCM